MAAEHTTTNGVAAEPPTRYEGVTRTRLDELGRQVDRLETKINALMVAALGSLLAALVHGLNR